MLMLVLSRRRGGGCSFHAEDTSVSSVWDGVKKNTADVGFCNLPTLTTMRDAFLLSDSLFLWDRRRVEPIICEAFPVFFTFAAMICVKIHGKSRLRNPLRTLSKEGGTRGVFIARVDFIYQNMSERGLGKRRQN